MRFVHALLIATFLLAGTTHSLKAKWTEGKTNPMLEEYSSIRTSQFIGTVLEKLNLYHEQTEEVRKLLHEYKDAQVIRKQTLVRVIRMKAIHLMSIAATLSVLSSKLAQRGLSASHLRIFSQKADSLSLEAIRFSSRLYLYALDMEEELQSEN